MYVYFILHDICFAAELFNVDSPIFSPFLGGEASNLSTQLEKRDETYVWECIRCSQLFEMSKLCRWSNSVSQVLLSLEHPAGPSPLFLLFRITYNSTLNACEKAADWQGALKLFDELEKESVEADVITYSAASLQSLLQFLQGGPLPVTNGL